MPGQRHSTRSKKRSKRTLWTKAHDAMMRARYPHESTAIVAVAVGHSLTATYARAKQLGLRKTLEYLTTEAPGRWNGSQGTAHRFQKGHVPWTKGRHYVAGGRSAETRFKTGMVSVRWDMEAFAVGALRITSDGVLDIKIDDRSGRFGWMALSRYVWMSEVGPIPEGFVVRCMNGDKYDTRLENLCLVSRTVIMQENTLHYRYPKPIARVMQLRGALVRTINRRKRMMTDATAD